MPSAYQHAVEKRRQARRRFLPKSQRSALYLMMMDAANGVEYAKRDMKLLAIVVGETPRRSYRRRDDIRTLIAFSTRLQRTPTNAAPYIEERYLVLGRDERSIRITVRIEECLLDGHASIVTPPPVSACRDAESDAQLTPRFGGAPAARERRATPGASDAHYPSPAPARAGVSPRAHSNGF